MGSKKITKEKSRKAAIYKGVKCLNCGQPLELTDNFCPNCSQINSTKQLSINDFFQEFLSSIFTYDSRLRYTLKDLLFKPGVITRNYVAGQRLKYANPFRFYLSISIVYFILQSFSTGDDLSSMDLDIDTSDNTEIVSETSDSTSNKKNKNYDSDTFNKELDSIIKSSVTKTEITKKNDTIITYLSEAELDTLKWSNSIMERFFLYREFYNNTKIENPVKALDSLNHPVNRVNKWIYNKNETIDRVLENPKNFIDFLLGKIPFFLFFFAPFYAFFFWIMYSMKKYNYMEHLVFIFHIFSFVFLSGAIAYFPDYFLLGDEGYISVFILVLIGPFYFYKALRNFYKQSRILTLFKFALLNFIFFIGTTIASIIFFSATAAIY